MFDHVSIAVSDLDASERFYRTVLSVLGAEPVRGDSQLVEWEDWDLFATDGEHPVSRGLHVGFRAPDRADYYGGLLLDPDGNSVEALYREPELRVPAGGIDHLWIRVRDLDASRRFYATIAPHAGLRLGDDEPGRVQFRGDGHSFSLIDDERPPTEHIHIAFGTDRDATVREFHAAALAAGYEDNGGPGERPAYHPGYYGAFVLDPDGNNIEVVNHNRG
jgi:catechol 2,3-dioxygenase-like lactoylglutathione lyase family enzyme